MHKKHLFRLLGLSMLVAVGVMAMSASAAQAKWVLLLNKAEVSNITLNVTAPVGELLVPNLGLAIICNNGGTGEVNGVVSKEGKLTGSAIVTFSGCTDLTFGEVCDVRSVGDPLGTIEASGSGEAGMNTADKDPNNDYFVNASSEEFTNIEYTHEGGEEEGECPLVEIDGRVHGSIQLDLLNALEDTKLKKALVLPIDLNFGGEDATLHDTNEKNLEVSLEHPGKEGTWAVHLVGL